MTFRKKGKEELRTGSNYGEDALNAYILDILATVISALHIPPGFTMNLLQSTTIFHGHQPWEVMLMRLHTPHRHYTLTFPGSPDTEAEEQV